MSPALAGRFFTTEPPGKPLFSEAFPDSYIPHALLYPKHSSMSSTFNALKYLCFKKHLFIWLCCVLPVEHRIFDLHCVMRTLTCGLWDLVPRAGIEPQPPASGVQSLNHWDNHQGSPT